MITVWFMMCMINMSALTAASINHNATFMLINFVLLMINSSCLLELIDGE